MKIHCVDEQYVPGFERVEESKADLLHFARDKLSNPQRRCKK